MKFVVIVGDGMADRPLKALNGKTPLQVANTPYMDMLASKGVVGMVRTIPKGLHPGSDIANLSILGYDPTVYYTGRAPLEAGSMGINMGESDVAYRCNLVTLKFCRGMTNAVMDDYSAGHITSDEARGLIETIQEMMGNEEFRFYPGVSYRHLMVWKNGCKDVECVPPHDITGKLISDYLPIGECSQKIQMLMRRSVEILTDHEINKQRMAKGLKPANSIWLWGQGKKPSLPLFFEKYGVNGALISAVDLTKGLGVFAGFKVINVPGATGWLDTNYEGKAQYGLDALNEVDFLYLHVEAPDEAGHSGRIDYKIQAIEDLDTRVIRPVFEGLNKRFKEFRLMVLPDHPTPIEIKTHSDEPVPFVLYDSTVTIDTIRKYDEQIHTQKDCIHIEKGHSLMDLLIKNQLR
ncbi:MAG: cofactor-independent phosphoglycerate mutase [Thermodesulfovibrionales bacterium]|nr:cofactor-independent phosphoglycerate mutase [Thermodesulfovibrionales bacterium]